MIIAGVLVPGLFYQGDDDWARAVYTDVSNAIEARDGVDIVFRRNVTKCINDVDGSCETLDGTGIVGAVDSFKEIGSRYTVLSHPCHLRL